MQLSGKDFKHILVIGSIGIGNLLMFRPVLAVLRQRLPHAKITLLVLKRGFAEVFAGDPLVDEVRVVDFRDYPGLMKKIGLVRDLRRYKFDLTITSFPANRLEYNALAFLTGAPYRVATCIPASGWRPFLFYKMCVCRWYWIFTTWSRTTTC